MTQNLHFITEDVWFHLSGYTSAQNNRYWSTINPDIWSASSWSEVWCVVWHYCNMNNRIHIFFTNCVNDIPWPFFRALWKKKGQGYFMHDVFKDRAISHWLWHERSPDVNPCDYYLLGNIKHRVFKLSPHVGWM